MNRLFPFLFLCLSIAASAAPSEPSSAQKEQQYGDAWADLGNFKRAVEHYRKAVKLDPGLTEARLNLANGLYRLGQKDQALAELDRLKRDLPESAVVACALGVIQLETGRTEDSCRNFEKSRTLDPSFERAIFGVGQCHQAMFEHSSRETEKQAASEGYRQYLERFPNGPYSISAREALDKLILGKAGKILAQAKEAYTNGKFRLAEQLLRQALADKPDIQEANYLLGMTLASPVINQVEEAAKAFRLAGTMKEALLQRGILAYEEEDFEQAEDLFGQLLSKDPKDASAHYYLGMVYRDQLRNSEAEKEFTQVTILSPDTPLGEQASSKLQLLTGNVQYLREGEVVDSASEIELGYKITSEIEKQFGLLDDPRLQLRLNEILRNLTKHSDGLPAAIPYRVKILNVDGINALSFVGGSIYLFKGLADFIRREMGDADDAYAAVLGHELVHIVLRHGLGMLDLVGGTRTLMDGQSFDLLSLNRLLTGISRIHEFEADHLGALYAYRAGFDPSAAYRFHRAIISQGKEVPEALDHPTHQERADRLKEYMVGLRAKARHFQKGLQALDTNQFETAIVHFEIFLGLFPQSSSAKNNLGVAMHSLALAMNQEARDYKLSTDIDPRSQVQPIRLRAAPGGPPGVNRALMTEAAALFDSLATQVPDYLPAQQNLGSCLVALGKLDEARRVFEKVLKKQTDAPQTLSNLAVVSLLKGEAAQAILKLQDLVTRHPGFADAYYNLALALQHAGRKDEARKTWLSFLERDKTSGWSQSARKHLAELKE